MLGVLLSSGKQLVRLHTHEWAHYITLCMQADRMRHDRGVNPINTQKFWAAFTGLILGVAALTATSASMAQSSNPDVANILGIMQSTALSEAQKDAQISGILSRSADPGVLVNALLVTGGTSANGIALSTSLSNTLVAVAKSTPALQSAIGIGMGRAAATMGATGYAGATGAIQAAARSSGLTGLTTGLQTGIQQGQNTAVFTLVISPSQACSTSC